ncbi:tripartite tricarboxylate transporter substrate-binding protein [Muricoccus radiodurans]|uniref:tripartite tricarboxylate transporter substrate-binding protein n=1 Tax=Muricoccus radiodurans TaxID=2231721 RepID=UPI003CF97D39
MPYPPGGATDLIGRQLAEGLARRLGQSVIVDNRAGAAGAVGVAATASSAPDGYTVVLAGSNNVAVDPQQERLPYRPATDLVPVAPAAALPYVVFAHPSFAPNTIAELIAAAKRAPGTINFASSGIGGPPHMASELLRAMAGIDVVHVPYRGAVPAVTDVVGGRVQFMTGDVNTALPFLQSGQLKAIATTGRQRMALLPNVPTVAESGLPGYEAEGWFGIFAPARTPEDVVARLARDIDSAMQDPAYVERMAGFGGRPMRMPPAEFQRFIASETRIRSDLIRTNGIALE